ncbi:MAG: AsnC family transcriptional regulator [Candidatus Bathyarchaeota archaeon]|nr:AsnC family transcriptional regulator [Candidatus Bathyarchaeota archaeon]
MFLDPLSLGYESIAEIGIITDLADKAKVIEFLSNKPSVKLSQSLGKYNVYGLVAVRKLGELSNAVQRIDYKPFVKGIDLLIYTDLWNNPWHPENLIINSSQPNELKESIKKPEPQPQFEGASIDETDKRIAKMLMENSRTTFKEIAEKTKISINNVIQRYQSLREKRVLNLSTISVDLFKLGYNAVTNCYIKVENRGALPEVEAQILQIPNASFCGKFVGGVYDLRVAVTVKDFEDVFQFKKRIQTIRDIKTAEFYIDNITSSWPGDFIGNTLLQKERLSE